MLRIISSINTLIVAKYYNANQFFWISFDIKKREKYFKMPFSLDFHQNMDIILYIQVRVILLNMLHFEINENFLLNYIYIYIVKINSLGITGLVQKLRHLCGFTRTSLTTNDNNIILVDLLHYGLLFCYNGQLRASFL